MSDSMRRFCGTPARFGRVALGIAAAGLLLHGQCFGQDLTGTVTTIGGTGEAGFVNGVHGISEFNAPVALALRGDGHLFIADYGNNVVRDLRVADTLAKTFVEIAHPVALAFDSEKNLFVAGEDGVITVFDYFANYVRAILPELSAGPITALAMDRNDNLYLAEQQGLVTRLDTNGVPNLVLRAPTDGNHDFRGLAVADDGTVYVSDSTAHVIWKFQDGVGTLLAGTLNQSGNSLGKPGYGRLNRPQNIAIGPNKSIIIADRGNQQVRVASCAGVITVLYGYAEWFTPYQTYPGWYDGTAEYAELREPTGLAADLVGNVYDSELYYNLIRTGQGLSFPSACNNTAPPPSTNIPPSLVLQPSSGYFPRGVTISITASNSASAFSRDTRLFYTLDGNAPTVNDSEILVGADGRARLTLEGPVDIAGLRVRAFLGETGGPIASTTATVVPVPVLSPDSGYYPMGIDVTVTSTNGFPEGTVIYYTDDGTPPTTNSTAVANDGTRAVIPWRDARKDLRSLRVRAYLGPNQGSVTGGRAVSFPGQPEVQGEIGVPPARAPFRAGIGSYYIVPIVANLRDSQILSSLQFVVELSALAGAPRLEKQDVQIIPISTNDLVQVLPATTQLPDSTISVARDGLNRLALAYYGTNSGFHVTAGYATVALLGIQFRAADALGNIAEPGDTYNLHISQVSGTSDGLQRSIVLNPMPDRTIRFENIQFREGDTAPAYWYNAGDFGDGVLDAADVNNAIFAAFGFRRPFSSSDAFAAIDVYRLGVLENVIEYNDAATILRRSLSFESGNVFRIRNEFGEWESSTTSVAPLARNSVRALASTTPGSMWKRDVTIIGGILDNVGVMDSVSVPVYMKAGSGVSVSGMQFVADVLPVDGAPTVNGVTFVPSPAIPAPQPMGSVVPGLGTLPNTVYARWDNLSTPLQGNVLLGYVRFTTPGTIQRGHHYNIVFHNTGGASVDADTGALTAYLFESIHGEVWPFLPHADGARISDDWKINFFGSFDTPEADASADPDGDGFSNLDEYIGGSDPNTSDWRVKVQSGRLSFRWVGHTGRSYRVERTEDFKSWNAVTGSITGQDTFQEYNELSTSAKAQFYRLNIQ